MPRARSPAEHSVSQLAIPVASTTDLDAVRDRRQMAAPGEENLCPRPPDASCDWGNKDTRSDTSAADLVDQMRWPPQIVE